MNLYIEHGNSPNRKNQLKSITNAYHSKIAIACDKGIHLIESDTILYCQAMGNYCQIKLRNGRSVMCSKTLKKISSYLDPSQFIRSHQSFLVNIKEINHVGQDIKISSSECIPVSRNKRKSVIDQILRMFPLVK